MYLSGAIRWIGWATAAGNDREIGDFGLMYDGTQVRLPFSRSSTVLRFTISRLDFKNGMNLVFPKVRHR